MVKVNARLHFSLLLLLALLCSAACQRAEPIAKMPPTVVFTATPTSLLPVHPSSTATIVATSSPSPTSTVQPTKTALPKRTPASIPTSTPVSTPTPQTAEADLSPLFTADHVRIAGWTPDGGRLAVWVASAENAIFGPRHPAPGAELWFVDASSGERCVHAQFSAETEWRGSVSWLDSGEVMVRLNDVIEPGGDGPRPTGNNRYFVGLPCQIEPFAERSEPPTNLLEERAFAGLSPSGTYYVETAETGTFTEFGPSQTTTLFETATNRAIITHDYVGSMGIGGPGLNGGWLNESQFLLRFAYGQESGPAILDARTGSVTSVVRELFGITELEPRYVGDEQGYQYSAYGVPDSAESKHKILLSSGSDSPDDPPLRLYHADTQTVETVSGFPDFVRPPATADGAWLRFYDAERKTWIRRSNDIGGAWQPLGEISHRALWPNGTDWLVNGQDARITFRRLGDAASAITLSTTPFNVQSHSWSPDNRYTVFIGQHKSTAASHSLSASAMAIFIVESPQP